MSTTKHVHRALWRKLRHGGEHDARQIRVALLLHHRHDAADGVNAEPVSAHAAGAHAAQVGMEPALDGTVEHGGAGGRKAGLRALCGLQHRLVHLVAGHVWAGEHVEHGRDVNADVALKGHDFFHADFNVPVHVGLKGARIGHDRAGVIQQVMHAVLKRMLAQFLVLPDDVTVRDEHLDAVGVPHLTWFDGSEVRIDDRQQRWGGDHPMRCGQRPHACSSVACLDLKTAHVILARGFWVVPRMLAPRRHGRPTAPCPSKGPIITQAKPCRKTPMCGVLHGAQVAADGRS